MSTVLVVAPVLIASWPAISAAVGAAVGGLGFALVQDSLATANRGKVDGMVREEIDVDDSEILGTNLGTSERLVVEGHGMRAIFSRDLRGGLKVCMEGHGVSKAQLRSMGEQLLGRVTQQYTYHRIVSELKERNMTIVDEQVTDTASVKIRVRNW